MAANAPIISTLLALPENTATSAEPMHPEGLEFPALVRVVQRSNAKAKSWPLSEAAIESAESDLVLDRPGPEGCHDLLKETVLGTDFKVPSCSAAIANNNFAFPGNQQNELINKHFPKILALALPNPSKFVEKLNKTTWWYIMSRLCLLYTSDAADD